ncbi:sensor histidine kinase [Spongiactinospora sp. TRM90649]|uniref:sensor histidine kinase n=1 Tax=Spongiactinospora sp. TRM90649 TaxID=3031114 RepID=UPI0023F8A197|nr:sensor histidine kinase [Spongiactinospora sp. TRM90649]MDF5751584.1 sensor histidine kinase [Spongiactinospora sp. TRM90649]
MTRRPNISTATLASVAAAGWLLLVTLPMLDRKPSWGIAELVGMAFVYAGVVAWRGRPRNRVGPLMVAFGIAWIPQIFRLQPDVPYLLLLWNPVSSVWSAVGCHLFLAFPTGRLGSLPSRLVVGFGYGEALILPVTGVAVEILPEGPLRSVAAFVDQASWQLIMLTAAAVLGLAAVRWREGGAAQRRAAMPVVLSSAVATIAFVVDWNFWAWGPETLRRVPATVMFGAFLAIPLAYLASLMRVRLDRGRVADLVVRLRGRKQRDGMESALATTLYDPTLRVAYWMAEQGRYVDAEGRPVELPPSGSGRVMTRVDQGESRLAVLLHDEGLLEEPLLVEAACAAAALALENERLTADLRARLRQLAASRARMLQWGEAERRKLERDLHDGVQQRLLSVAMTLGLAEATTDPDRKDTLVSEAKRAMLTALDDLRAVSHGIHPPVLTERGLPGAVKELAAVAPVPVECLIDMAEPLPPAVESAAYYIVNEGLANVTKHAEATRAWVRLAGGDGHLVVEIGDDGRGGADPRLGSGLEGLAHRAEANGGRLRLDSRPGMGTVLAVTLPCG